MKVLIVALVALCLGYNGVSSAPSPGKLGYPWTDWLKVKAPLTTTTAPAPVPLAEVANGGISSDEFLEFLSRAILPKPEKSKAKSKFTSANLAALGETTTKLPIVEDGFWAPPLPSVNATGVPEVIDPTYWAAKKTMFISKLFAALAKQVLNSTGELEAPATTTVNPQEALLHEIDSVLLTDAARSIIEDSAEAKGSKKTAAKPAKKGAKPGAVPFYAKFFKTTEAPVEVVTTTPHPTLDYAALAKALLS